jgi:tripartite-type tricarboxylate transporter receptor subunit TctC
MTTITKRAFIGSTIALSLSVSFAADFPDHPVKLVIPYAPGGPTDVLGRVVAEYLGRVLNQPVIVENKGGAGGIVAMGQVAKAKADGYTLLLGDMTLAVSSSLHKSLPFDPVKDFTPIGMIATAPMLMLVPSTSSIKTAQEYVALAKSHPGKNAYASAGIGSPTHLAAEVLKANYSLDIIHVPFQGSGPAMTALASGETGLMFTGLSGAKPLLDGGKVRALAITGEQRSPVLPNVPTLKQAGLTLPELTVVCWRRLACPRPWPNSLPRRCRLRSRHRSSRPAWLT